MFTLQQRHLCTIECTVTHSSSNSVRSNFRFFVVFSEYSFGHLLSCNLPLLLSGIDARPVGGVLVSCGAIPIGIEPQQFLRKLKDPGVIEAIKTLKAQFGKRKV